jgi:hypothetical protein
LPIKKCVASAVPARGAASQAEDRIGEARGFLADATSGYTDVDA